MQKEYVYTVYKVTNIANGKFYIGVHKTKDINDKYLGSGEGIKRAILKYGKRHFTKEILFIYENAELAYDKEAELVDAEVVASGDCYNRHVGGFGKGIAVANMLGLNNKNKPDNNMYKLREGFKKWAKNKKENPTFTDDVLLKAYESQGSINKAISSLGSNSRPLRRRLSELLKQVYGAVPTKPGPPKKK